MTSALLTPFYDPDSEAVDLGNRVWRRQILPVGDVNYKGRVLRFTKNYLQKLAQSFRDGAYAQVPFQLADAQNTHTNDPERTRGEITEMEVRDDGLWVTAELSERGDALLRENPKLGVSARIVEDYDRADGRHFPVAVQHVLGTLDPRISWMGGAWEAIEAASPEPEKVLDLSSESFTELTGPGGWSHGWKHVGEGTTVVSDKEMAKPAGWLGKGTADMNPGEAADRMSKNIAGHSFNSGAGGREAQQAHKAAAKAHRAAAKSAGSQSAISHHTRMAKVHSAVAAGRRSYNTDLAGDGADPEGGAVMAGLKSLTEEQRQRLEKLLALPDETLDALAAGGTVITPAELEALTAPGNAADAGDDAEAEALAAEIAAMSDDDLAALEAEFEAGAEGNEPAQEPEREPVAAGMSAEAQFAINLANAKADETARELAVVTARLREEDFQGEKRRLADAGVPPYITELARPLLEGAGHAVELSNGKTVDAGAIMRRVLAEYGAQVRLLDLGTELGSPMDEPDDAGREEAETSRAEFVSRFRSMTGA